MSNQISLSILYCHQRTHLLHKRRKKLSLIPSWVDPFTEQRSREEAEETLASTWAFANKPVCLVWQRVLTMPRRFMTHKTLLYSSSSSSSTSFLNLQSASFFLSTTEKITNSGNCLSEEQSQSWNVLLVIVYQFKIMSNLFCDRNW